MTGRTSIALVLAVSALFVLAWFALPVTRTINAAAAVRIGIATQIADSSHPMDASRVLIDPWGRNVDVLLFPDGTVSGLRSSGPNGLREAGFGDDISVPVSASGSKTFVFPGKRACGCPLCRLDADAIVLLLLDVAVPVVALSCVAVFSAAKLLPCRRNRTREISLCAGLGLGFGLWLGLFLASSAVLSYALLPIAVERYLMSTGHWTWVLSWTSCLVFGVLTVSVVRCCEWRDFGSDSSLLMED